MIPVALLVVAGIIGAVWWNRSSKENEVRTAAVSNCVEAGESRATCKQRVERNHDQCFDWAYDPGSRYSRSSVDTNVYETCIKKGAEAYTTMREERRRKNREKSQKVRERQQEYMP